MDLGVNAIRMEDLWILPLLTSRDLFIIPHSKDNKNSGKMKLNVCDEY